MTSLARQLERLAVPHTQAVLTTDKRRVSLLFDPKEAANLDREAVYALGHSGLEELENIDEAFNEYELSLFNQSSQSWERTLQTHDVNSRLDQTLHKYLVHISPYLLLKSTHKTLEWLIYRYHIHQINVDDLILCSLPYHDTKVFVRIIQLINLSDPTGKWHWLHAAAKSGTPLARGSLVNHCKKDPGFLSLLCDLLPKFIKVHGYSSTQLRPIIALVTCSILATISHCDDITERIVSILVPNIAIGLKSKCEDFTSSSYMILSQLCSQVKMKEAVLQMLIPILTKKLKNSLSIEGLSCLSLIYETQKLENLPKKSFKHLCRIPGLIQLLIRLSNKHVVPTLLQVMIKRLIPVALEKGDFASFSSTDGSDDFGDGSPQYASLLIGILQDIPLEESLSHSVTKMILNMLVKKRPSLKTEDSYSNWISVTKKLLKALQGRYNAALDEAIKDIFEHNKQNEAVVNILQEITSMTTMPMKYDRVGHKKCSLVIGLNHADLTTRILAVKQLVQSVNKETPLDDFVAEAVSSRLQDDHFRILEEVLQLNLKLLEIVPLEILQSSLLKILQKGYGKSKWVPCLITVLDLLCTMLSQHPESSVLGELLPYLLITDCENSSNFTIAKTIIGISHRKKVTVLESMSEAWMKVAAEGKSDQSKNKNHLNSIVVQHLAKYFLQLENAGSNNMILRFIESTSNNQATHLVLLVLTEIIQNCDSVDVKLTIGKHLVSVVKKVEVAGPKLNVPVNNLSNNEEQQTSWLKILHDNKQQLSIGVVVWSFKYLTEALSQIKIQDTWCKYENPHHKLMIDVLYVILHNSCFGKNHKDSWRQLMQKWICTELDISCLLKITSLIWLSEDVSALLKVGSFSIVERLLLAYSGDVSSLLTTNICLLPSLMVSLISEYPSIRTGALNCLKAIKKKEKHHNYLHGSLIKKLIKREEEVSTDPSHTPQVIGIFFSSEDVNKQKSLDDITRCIGEEHTPLPVKEKLLAFICTVPHKFVLQKFIPLGKRMLEKLEVENAVVLRLGILNHILKRFDEESAPAIDEKSEEFSFIVDCLNYKTANFEKVHLMTIKQIKSGFFHALPTLTIQQRLIGVILDTMFTHKGNSNLITEANSCLRHLKLNGAHVRKELNLGSEDIGTLKGRKRTRIESTPVNYTRLSWILEVLETRKQIKDSVKLAEMLCSVLKRLLTDNEEETEYCKQLVLITLCNQCSKWNEENKPKSQESMNIELLVQCLRNSPSPQTQHQALMVMSSVANLFPEYILHNVMSVFTFMGSNLLQQDDNHSYQITVRTLETLIPAIIQAQSGSTDTSRDLVTQILQVFVDSRHHIPKHRSQLLFQKVLQTVGTQAFSWVLAIQVIESSVRKKDIPDLLNIQDTADKDKSRLERDLDFICQLCEDMDVLQRLEMANAILLFLQKFTAVNQDIKGHSVQQPRAKTVHKFYPVHCDTLSHQQLRLIQFNVTKLVVLLLSKELFISQMLQEMENNAFTTIFQSFVKECLSYVTLIAKVHGSNSSVPSGKFWKAVLAKSYEILDKVNYLLPSTLFLNLIAPLIHHDQSGVRIKAMELLSSKLQQIDSKSLTEQQVEQLLNMVDMLLSVISSDTFGETENVIFKQFSLFILKVLSKLLGSQYPKAFTKVFPKLVAVMSAQNTSAAVLGNCLLCLAELCTSLKAHAIPYLNAFIKPLLNVLKDMELLRSNELVLVCSLTAVQRVLYSLAHFVSPYLKQILMQISVISRFVQVDTVSSSKSQSAIKLRTVKHHLATDIPARVLIPAVSETYSELMESKEKNVTNSLQCLLHIMKEHIEAINKDDLNTHQAGLRELFCKSLDIRNAEVDITQEEVLSLEDLSIETLLSMVVRLSEMSFRPLYYRLYDWACREESEMFKVRRITFFRLSQKLSARLKSLFNMFVSHSLKMSCQMLDQNNTCKGEVRFYGTDQESTEKSCELIQYIMGMIYSVLLHDSDDFVTKEIFNMLLHPLVNQIENFVGDPEKYNLRITQQVVPCISQLIIAAREESLWKALSYQVCLKTRHNSPKVRFATLQVIGSIAEKLGEEYMGLLPETIPFLAELMEDESEEVEQQCQQVVSSLEEILGESLQKYF